MRQLNYLTAVAAKSGTGKGKEKGTATWTAFAERSFNYHECMNKCKFTAVAAEIITWTAVAASPL